MTAAPTPAADLTGAILSRRYALEGLIGTGGMGSVYLSKSPDDGRALAVKVLGLEHVADDDIKARFVSEGRVCQRLIHPNIVRVVDVGEAEDGTPYIVMERLEGVPLSAYTRAGVRVPMAQAANILQGILAGLGAAHAQGIVHRDLKPENVFLAREPNGSFCAKILDFGIAKVMDAAGGMGSKTRTGVLLGTPAYMSPEQVKSSKDVDARSDLWSAGVMLYEMLTGHVAFPAPTEYARLAAVLNATPPPIESADPQLARLSAFVARAMQKDRTQRFASALEMARALSAAVGVEATHSVAAHPLSRLPDVPSVLGPALGPAEGAATVAALGAPLMTPPKPEHSPSIGPSGTLASAQRDGRRSSEAPSRPIPEIPIVGASAGTLPSENLPMLRAHGSSAKPGVPVWAVVALVTVALAAGFLLGFASARSL